MQNDIDAGVEAFRKGDAKNAFAILKNADAVSPLTGEALLVLAYAARRLEEYKTALEVIDRFLEKHPTHPDATLIKADCFKALGKPRFAAGFYRAFIGAVQKLQSTPAHLQPEIARAQQEIQNAAAAYQEFLEDKISGAGFKAGDGRSRVGQAMDIMLGRKTIYTQAPAKFYFPELPQIQYYDPKDFDWVPAIVEQAGVIKDELNALVSADEEFDPYVKHNINVPKISTMGQQLLGSTDWSAYHFYADSEPQPAHMARCPKTLEILKAAPVPSISTVSPSVLFSKLTAGSHIPPHSGVCNARLICHLPLMTPEGCWLRVGNQTREWRDGEMLIFDDTIEHEAMNPTGETRIILLFDIWRPELNEDERRFVETVFDAVGSYQSDIP